MATSKAFPMEDIERATIRIAEGGTHLTLDYEGARAWHKGNSWWGVTVGYRAMQAAGGMLSQTGLWTRDQLHVVSAHPGPGVRDAIDYVTRCVERQRFHLLGDQAGKSGCCSDMKYEWWLSTNRITVAVKLRPDFVPEEFYDLLDRLGDSRERDEDRQRFEALKSELETRIWQAPLATSFHVERLSNRLKPGEQPDR